MYHNEEAISMLFCVIYWIIQMFQTFLNWSSYLSQLKTDLTNQSVPKCGSMSRNRKFGYHFKYSSSVLCFCIHVIFRKSVQLQELNSIIERVNCINFTQLLFCQSRSLPLHPLIEIHCICMACHSIMLTLPLNNESIYLYGSQPWSLTHWSLERMTVILKTLFSNEYFHDYKD